MCDFEEIGLSPSEIDGWEEEQEPWGYDPFGPDAGIWDELMRFPNE